MSEENKFPMYPEIYIETPKLTDRMPKISLSTVVRVKAYDGKWYLQKCLRTSVWADPFFNENNITKEQIEKVFSWVTTDMAVRFKQIMKDAYCVSESTPDQEMLDFTLQDGRKALVLDKSQKD